MAVTSKRIVIFFFRVSLGQFHAAQGRRERGKIPMIAAAPPVETPAPHVSGQKKTYVGLPAAPKTPINPKNI
jgi:hypothetical protein